MSSQPVLPSRATSTAKRSAARPRVTNRETFSSSSTTKIRISQSCQSRRCELSPHECYMKFHSGPDVLRPPKLSQSGGSMEYEPCRSFYDLRPMQRRTGAKKPPHLPPGDMNAAMEPRQF